MIKAGKNPPLDLYAFIEVPQDSFIKYELDKETNTLFVDRFLFTSMIYPFNYGFIPQTKADDGDPLDILVISRYGVIPGSVLRCRPVGALEMSDESGYDLKIIAVVHSKLDPSFDNIKDINDIPKSTLDRIKHFFENYKTIEPGKWVKVDSFKGLDFALEVIKKSIVEN